MACVFPDAHTPAELWQNVLAGRRSFRRLPDERVPLALYHDPDPAVPDRTYSDQAAFIKDWSFPWREFAVAPVTQEVTDPVHWLALWTAREALRDAAFDLSRHDRGRIGVILGNSLGGDYGRSTYLRYRWPHIERALRAGLAGSVPPGAVEDIVSAVRHRALDAIPPITEDSLPGTMSNTIAGRICNHFDLGGGGHTVDAACASSLVALAQACDALVSGRWEVALAGAVDLSIDPYELIGFAKARALAREDCRPYDERAAGLLPGEGCGVFVLMREADARRAGYPVRAVIRGWGTSSDGRGGITAPEREGQLRAMRAAYAQAGYSIGSVELIEGHGTGTALGDRVEIEALLALLPKRAHVRLGSIKSNIGHCKAAAGAAGLVKAVMALQRQIIPPTAACTRPHSLFGAQRPLAPALHGEHWTNIPRRAGVSAFGFGGANAHLTLEEADAAPSPEDFALLGASQETELLFLSAPDMIALKARVDVIRGLAGYMARSELTDLSAALAESDTGARHRLALVAPSPWQLAQQLERVQNALASGETLATIHDPVAGLYAGSVDPQAPAPCWVALFPGQGSQRPGMSGHLPRRYPFVASLLHEIDAAIAHTLPEGVRRWIAADAPPGSSPRLERQLSATHLAQPAIVAASLAQLEVLAHYGLHPDIVVGHSLGEISALAAAGACDAATAVRLAAERGLAMSHGARRRGAMLAVAAEAETLAPLLAPFRSKLAVANFNAPKQTVVSGLVASIEDLLRVCRARRIPCRRLPATHAFHSPYMAPAAQAVRQILESVDFSPPRIRLVSPTTGGLLSADSDLRRLLTEQITQPVRFTEALAAATSFSPAFWVEVGPGNVLSQLVRDTLGVEQVFPTDRTGQGGHDLLNAVLAQSWVLGLPVKTGRLFQHRFHRPFPLEGYRPRLLVNPCEAPPRTETTMAKAAPQPPPQANERANILAYVSDWIVRRTGHPRELATEDRRLRDDLNLDSIKTAELVQALAGHWQAPVQPPVGWENRRIGELVDAVIQARAGSGADAQVRPLPGEGEGWVHSFTLGCVAAPLQAEHPIPLPAGARVKVLGEANTTLTITVALDAAGYRTSYIGAPEAVVWLLSDRPKLFGEQFGEQLRHDIETLLGVGRQIVESPMRLLALRRAADPASTDPADAPAAFLRSLAQEFPALHVKWLVIPATWEAARMAEVALAELAYEGRYLLYRYDNAGLRQAEVARPITTTRPPLHLAKEDVVLVSGGARGITLDLAQELLRGSGAHCILIGRTTGSAPEAALACQRLEQAGARVHYVSCDITDPAAVTDMVRRVEHESGPITAILHGAGYTRPTNFQELDTAHFLRSTAPKVLGLHNLLAAVPCSQIKALHVLSSVIGTCGMARQPDYAYANAWLNGAVASLQAEYPHLHGLALGYSVWQGTGMGETLGALDVLKALGVSPVSREQGVAAYRALLDGHGDTARIIITGRLAPALEQGLFSTPPAPGLRFLARILRQVPGVELVSEATLSHASDLYLRHHVFAGTPLLPAVMGVEAMVAAAMACTGATSLPTLRNVRFLRPVIVQEGSALNIRLHALCTDQQHVHVTLRCQTDAYMQDYFSASCDFTARAPQADALQFPLPGRLPLDPEVFAPDPMFQGRFFRRITSVLELNPGVGCLAEVYIPEGKGYFGPGVPSGLATSYPASRDAFLQTLMLCLSERRGLPTGIRELRFLRPLPPGALAICRTRDTPDGWNIDVFSRDGELVETLRGITIAEIAARLDPNRVAGNLPLACRALALSIETNTTGNSTDAPRARVSQANLRALRRAAHGYAARHHDIDLDVSKVGLEHAADGRPLLRLAPELTELFADATLSISDTDTLSAAVVGPPGTGLDLESVTSRPTDLWRHLLGEAAYDLALQLARDEPFDIAATRVWTLLEAAVKSGTGQPDCRAVTLHREGSWLILQLPGLRCFSTLLTGEDSPTVLTLSATTIDQGTEAAKQTGER